jgi:hypothetical protein
MTGRRASDWLRALPVSDEEAGWNGAERRGAPKRPLDPCFAATLLNQLMPANEVPHGVYPAKRVPRAGIAVNVRA